MNRLLFVLSNLLAISVHAVAFFITAAFIMVAAYPDNSLIKQCLDWLGGV